jgi:PAS domain S-box-containing protein
MIGKLKSRKYHLRTALIVPFVVQIVGVVGLVGYLSFRNGHKAVDNLANQLTEETGARIEQRVTNYLDKSQNTLRLNYAALQSGSLNLNDVEALYRYFWQVIHTGQFEGSLFYGNERGEFVEVEYLGEDNIQLHIRTDDTAPLQATYRLDEQGNRAERLNVSQDDPWTRSWDQTAKQAGQPTWSEIYPFVSGDLTVSGISPVYPIYDAQDELVGVLSINVPLTYITDFINKLFVGSNGQSFIIETSGELVASSGMAQPFEIVGTGETQEVQRIQATQSDDPVIKATAQHLLEHFNGFESIQDSQRLKLQADGAWYYAHVMPIQDGRGINWLSVVICPERHFMAEIIRNTRNTALLCLAALGVAIIVAIITSRWITHPVLRISNASDQLAQGNLEQRVSPSQVIEINTLANSFNAMARQLKNSFTTLEQKNEKLRIAEENYRSIFENALEGIFQSTPEGRYLSVNPALAKIYGYDSPQEMIENITDIGGQLYCDADKRVEFRQQLDKQDTIKNFEYRCYRKDSSIIWTQIDARVVRDNNGVVLYYEGIVQDITERKHREAELRRQLEELKIEIDEQKKEKEVATLTQSSYFQEVEQEMAGVNLDEFWS